MLIFFVNTWKFILKQLVALGSVITSQYSVRLRLSEYRLVITSPSATIIALVSTLNKTFSIDEFQFDILGIISPVPEGT